MFKEERKQYAEDCKNHERAWELWEYNAIAIDTWKPLMNKPSWHADCIYRRKQTFVHEYFSGLNWRDAEHLIGKTVEYANHPDSGWHVGTLKDVSRDDVIAHFDIISDVEWEVDFFVYIRTCEKTFKHPIINICGVELPKPETVAPELGAKYWLSPTCTEMYWCASPYDISELNSCRVHLAEERAKSWTDWWENAVIDKMK